MSLDVEYEEYMGQEWEVWGGGKAYFLKYPLSGPYLRIRMFDIITSFLYSKLYTFFNRKNRGIVTAYPSKMRKFIRYTVRFLSSRCSTKYGEDYAP